VRRVGRGLLCRINGREGMVGRSGEGCAVEGVWERMGTGHGWFVCFDGLLLLLLIVWQFSYLQYLFLHNVVEPLLSRASVNLACAY